MNLTTYNTKKRTTVIAVVLAAAIALTPISFNVANAQDDRGNHGERGNRYAYGHQIHIPPIIYFLADWEDRHGWLPPGLARLLERYAPYLEDDEPIDESPELTDSSVEAGFTDATIILEFNEDVQARVFVSENEGFEKDDAGVLRARERSYMDEHQFMFEGLTEGTEYFYLVEFRDKDGNMVTSDEMSFMTEASDTDPEIVDVDATTSMTAADVAIEFSEDVQARLYVASYSGFVPRNADVAKITNRDFMSTQAFMIDSLEPDTEYFHRVLFRDADGNRVWSDEMSFMTKAEVASDSDPEITEFTADIGTSTADVEIDFSEAVKARLYVASYSGFNLADADVATISNNDLMNTQEFMLDGLSPETEYFHRVQFRDADGNTILSDEMSFTTEAEAEPEDTTGPVISDIGGDASTTSITVSWMTDEPATSAIYTSTSTGFGLEDAGVVLTEDAVLTTDHELMITGLTASTTYYHRIVSEDEAGNETTSEEFEFGTS